MLGNCIRYLRRMQFFDIERGKINLKVKIWWLNRLFINNDTQKIKNWDLMKFNLKSMIYSL